MVTVAAIAEIHWIDSQTKSWIWRLVTPLIITHKMMYVGRSLLNIKKTDERAHTPDLSHHCRNGEIMFVHRVYQDFRQSF